MYCLRRRALARVLYEVLLAVLSARWAARGWSVLFAYHHGCCRLDAIPTGKMDTSSGLLRSKVREQSFGAECLSSHAHFGSHASNTLRKTVKNHIAHGGAGLPGSTCPVCLQHDRVIGKQCFWHIWFVEALLHKSAAGRTTPIPRRIYPMRTVCGVPSAVK